ncbi:hypothetical protein PM082_023603 [Marasmius tenuissimus]|nr:hypothetical protein PM082_023603 [Marasmius tenuissimus]
MSDKRPSDSITCNDFGTSNHGDRNATYNQSTIHSYHVSSGPPRSGVERLADYVAPTALHSSKSRNTRTGCLEGTRVNIIHSLTRWVEDPSKKHRVCWVHGGAGVGKSAVAQTICEISARKSQLAASFFFSRNDGQRSTLDKFFPTISHQLATHPALKKAGLPSFIDDNVPQSPNGPQEMNLEGQFQSLISQPCAQIDMKQWKTLPKLVVIDGLDECLGGLGTSPSHAQETLLSIIRNATSTESPLPLHFMIFSRPERTILNFFENTLFHELLDMRKFRAQADHDIRKYLEKQFGDLAESYPEILTAEVWPGKEAVEKLVGKADGHFVYAVTVMKYITGDDASLPTLQERLDIVLQTEETTSYPDLSDLDQLYHVILRRFSYGNFPKQVLHPILQVIMTPHPEMPLTLDTHGGRSPYIIARLLQFDSQQCFATLSQLRSVLYVPKEGRNGDVYILHASFSDFLIDGHRSRDFCVQPLSLISYLDLFSRCVSSDLMHKMRQHQRGDRLELSRWTIGLELWSFNSWCFVNALLTSPVIQYVPSGELISTITHLNLYSYFNMVLGLDRRFMKSIPRGLHTALAMDKLIKFRPSGGLNTDIILWSYDEIPYWVKPTSKHQKFFCFLLRVLVVNMFHLRSTYHHLKSIRVPDDLRSFYDHLHQFIEGDWLVGLPREERKRDVSLSHLGCMALSASIDLKDPSVHPNRLTDILDILSPTIKDRNIPSTLKVLPHGELKRTKAELSLDEFELFLVTPQQRSQFSEEVKQSRRTIEFRGLTVEVAPPRLHFTRKMLKAVPTATFDGLADKYLTSSKIDLTEL